MRFYAKLMLAIATVVWAGTATAGTIDVTVTNAGHVDSETVYAPSDLISVDITVDAVEAIGAYFLHVQWSPDLSVAGITAIDAPHPGVYWQTLGGSGTQDAFGVYFNSTDVVGVGGVFMNELVGQVVFHVVDADGSADIIVGLLGPDDVVLDPTGTVVIPMTGSAVTIHTPEPTTALLLGLGMIGIAYAGRRR